MNRLGIVVLAMGLTSSVASAADCQIDAGNFIPGQAGTIHMTVKSGRGCGVSLTTRGGGMTGLAVAQLPSHGRATVTSKTGWGYVSVPNYVGADRFIMKTSAELMGRYVQRGDIDLTIDVNVVP